MRGNHPKADNFLNAFRVEVIPDLPDDTWMLIGDHSLAIIQYGEIRSFRWDGVRQTADGIEFLGLREVKET